MELEITEVRTEGERVVAAITETATGYSVEASCWAELLAQWDVATVRAYLVKEAVPDARQKVAEAIATARLEGDEERVATLTAFAGELEAEIPVRVDAAYAAMVAQYAQEPERAAVCQAEWDAWKAAHPNVGELAGTV